MSAPLVTKHPMPAFGITFPLPEELRGWGKLKETREYIDSVLPRIGTYVLWEDYMAGFLADRCGAPMPDVYGDEYLHLSELQEKYPRARLFKKNVEWGGGPVIVEWRHDWFEIAEGRKKP